MFCQIRFFYNDIGYFTRVHCIQEVVKTFLASTASSSQQVINIGAGYDTTAFHLIEEGLPNIQIYELDFPDIIKKKVELLMKSLDIRQLLYTEKPAQEHKTDYGYDFGQLRLLGVDLNSSHTVVDMLRQAGLDTSVPTLVITECVLVCK